MSIGELILWFYRLPIEDAVRLLLVCTLAYCWIKETMEHRRWWKPAVACALAALTVAILCSTMRRTGGSNYHVNLIPFHSYRAVQSGANPELYRSNFMNAALFYPAGLLLTSLLPQKWPGWCRCLLAVALLAAMSGSIEYIQYRCALGNVEIDDVIHNTAGALAGSLAAEVLSSVADRIKKIAKKETK